MSAIVSVRLVIFDAQEDLNRGPNVFDQLSRGYLGQLSSLLHQLLIGQFLNLKGKRRV